MQCTFTFSMAGALSDKLHWQAIHLSKQLLDNCPSLHSDVGLLWKQYIGMLYAWFLNLKWRLSLSGQRTTIIIILVSRIIVTYNNHCFILVTQSQCDLNVVYHMYYTSCYVTGQRLISKIEIIMSQNGYDLFGNLYL